MGRGFTGRNADLFLFRLSRYKEIKKGGGNRKTPGVSRTSFEPAMQRKPK
jgi:hypothetical protein